MRATKEGRDAGGTMVLAAAYDHRPPELDTVSAHWQLALDATDRALEAAAKTLTATEIGHDRSALVEERRETAQELVDLARMTGVRPAPWLSSLPLSKEMLGLPREVTTCLFDLDGVLTDNQALHRRGSTALRGSRRYLEALAHAGLRRAVVSASANMPALLELAGLATLVDLMIDAEAIKREGLRSPPAPDMLLAACRRLGARPEEAVTFTHTAAGVAAGHEAGLMVVGVARGAQAERLKHLGSERVVPSLAGLLEPRLLFDIPPSVRAV